MSAMTRTAPRYYIRIDTYWQGDPDRYVGPFATRSEAEAEIERAWERAMNSQGFPGTIGIAGMASPQNLRDAIRVHGVLSATEAKRLGMRQDGFRDNVLPGKTIPRNSHEMMLRESGLTEADL